MTDAIVIVAFLIMFGTTLAASYYFGREANKTRHIANVKDYLDHTIPNEWAAYKHGVNEGYEQGLRDKEEDPDEPA